MLWKWSIFLQSLIKKKLFFPLWFLLHWYFQEHLGMFSQVERTHPAMPSHVARVRVKPLCPEGEGQYVSAECWLLFQVSDKAGSRCCPCGLSAWNDRVGAKPPALSLPFCGCTSLPSPRILGVWGRNTLYSVFSSARNSQQEGWLCSQTSDPFNVYS